jgi:hypothetical protein
VLTPFGACPAGSVPREWRHSHALAGEARRVTLHALVRTCSRSSRRLVLRLNKFSNAARTAVRSHTCDRRGLLAMDGVVWQLRGAISHASNVSGSGPPNTAASFLRQRPASQQKFVCSHQSSVVDRARQLLSSTTAAAVFSRTLAAGRGPVCRGHQGKQTHTRGATPHTVAMRGALLQQPCCCSSRPSSAALGAAGAYAAGHGRLPRRNSTSSSTSSGRGAARAQRAVSSRNQNADLQLSPDAAGHKPSAPSNQAEPEDDRELHRCGWARVGVGAGGGDDCPAGARHDAMLVAGPSGAGPGAR